MAEYDINAKITYDTTQATTALKGVSQAAGETAKQTEKVGEATQKSQVQIGQFGSALGLAGQAAGQLSPALGSVASTAGAATGVIQGLTTAGLGPLGIAISAVAVAVTAGVGIWKAFNDQQVEARKKADELKKSLDAQVESLDDIIDRNRRIAGEQERQRRIAAGGGTREELQAQVEQAEQLVRTRQLAAAAARGDVTIGEQEGGFGANLRLGFETLGLARARTDLFSQMERGEDIRLANSQLEAATRRLAAARASLAEAEGRNFMVTTIEEGGVMQPGSPGWLAYAQANNLDPRTGRPRRRPRGGGRAAAESAETAAPAGSTLDELMARAGAPSGRAFGLQGLDIESLGREEESWMAEQDSARAKQLEADRQAGIEKNRIAEELGKERLRIEEELNSALLNSVESALASSVDAWLSGTQSIGEAMQSMVKSIAKSLASEAIIQGLKETALGISALAVGSPSAAIHFAAVGKWAAVGAAAGLVGAATGAFGGGGGGGGGAPAAATGGPALTAGAREGAGTTVVINWGSSGLVYAADRAQLGRDISGMISEAHGRLGRGM